MDSPRVNKGICARKTVDTLQQGYRIENEYTRRGLHRSSEGRYRRDSITILLNILSGPVRSATCPIASDSAITRRAS